VTAHEKARKRCQLQRADPTNGNGAARQKSSLKELTDWKGSAEEARELREDIDKVLATGGFHIKKWITIAPTSIGRDSREVVLGGEVQTEKVLGTV